jgi:hypothetical protein
MLPKNKEKHLRKKILLREYGSINIYHQIQEPTFFERNASEATKFREIKPVPDSFYRTGSGFRIKKSRVDEIFDSGFIRSTSPTPSETLKPFRSVSVTSQQSEIERPLSTTSQQSSSKKQQTFDLTARVLKIIEGLGDENRTSLKGILRRRTNVELRCGKYEGE